MASSDPPSFNPGGPERSEPRAHPIKHELDLLERKEVAKKAISVAQKITDRAAILAKKDQELDPRTASSDLTSEVKSLEAEGSEAHNIGGLSRPGAFNYDARAADFAEQTHQQLEQQLLTFASAHVSPEAEPTLVQQFVEDSVNRAAVTEDPELASQEIVEAKKALARLVQLRTDHPAVFDALRSIVDQGTQGMYRLRSVLEDLGQPGAFDDRVPAVVMNRLVRLGVTLNTTQADYRRLQGDLQAEADPTLKEFEGLAEQLIPRQKQDQPKNQSLAKDKVEKPSELQGQKEEPKSSVPELPPEKVEIITRGLSDSLGPLSDTIQRLETTEKALIGDESEYTGEGKEIRSVKNQLAELKQLAGKISSEGQVGRMKLVQENAKSSITRLMEKVQPPLNQLAQLSKDKSVNLDTTRTEISELLQNIAAATDLEVQAELAKQVLAKFTQAAQALADRASAEFSNTEIASVEVDGTKKAIDQVKSNQTQPNTLVDQETFDRSAYPQLELQLEGLSTHLRNQARALAEASYRAKDRVGYGQHMLNAAIKDLLDPKARSDESLEAVIQRLKASLKNRDQVGPAELSQPEGGLATLETPQPTDTLEPTNKGQPLGQVASEASGSKQEKVEVQGNGLDRVREVAAAAVGTIDGDPSAHLSVGAEIDLGGAIGKIKVERILESEVDRGGHGSTSMIYFVTAEAGPLQGQEFVAKQMRQKVYLDPEAQARYFNTEAALLKTLNEKGLPVPKLYGYQKEGTRTIYMEKAPGISITDSGSELYDLEGPFPPKLALELGIPVMQTFQALSEMGLIRQDWDASEIFWDGNINTHQQGEPLSPGEKLTFVDWNIVRDLTPDNLSASMRRFCLQWGELLTQAQGIQQIEASPYWSQVPTGLKEFIRRGADNTRPDKWTSFSEMITEAQHLLKDSRFNSELADFNEMHQRQRELKQTYRLINGENEFDDTKLNQLAHQFIPDLDTRYPDWNNSHMDRLAKAQVMAGVLIDKIKALNGYTPALNRWSNPDVWIKLHPKTLDMVDEAFGPDFVKDVEEYHWLSAAPGSKRFGLSLLGKEVDDNTKEHTYWSVKDELDRTLLRFGRRKEETVTLSIDEKRLLAIEDIAQALNNIPKRDPLRQQWIGNQARWKFLIGQSQEALNKAIDVLGPDFEKAQAELIAELAKQETPESKPTQVEIGVPVADGPLPVENKPENQEIKTGAEVYIDDGSGMKLKVVETDFDEALPGFVKVTYPEDPEREEFVVPGYLLSTQKPLPLAVGDTVYSARLRGGYGILQSDQPDAAGSYDITYIIGTYRANSSIGKGELLRTKPPELGPGSIIYGRPSENSFTKSYLRINSLSKNDEGQIEHLEVQDVYNHLPPVERDVEPPDALYPSYSLEVSRERIANLQSQTTQEQPPPPAPTGLAGQGGAAGLGESKGENNQASERGEVTTQQPDQEAQGAGKPPTPAEHPTTEGAGAAGEEPEPEVSPELTKEQRLAFVATGLAHGDKANREIALNDLQEKYPEEAEAIHKLVDQITANPEQGFNGLIDKRFQALAKVDPVQLGSLIQNEHPQMIATVLSHLPAEQAARLLTTMPSDLLQDVTHRILTSEPADPKMVDQIAEILTKEVHKLPNIEETPRGGIDQLNSILYQLPISTHFKLLESMYPDYPELIGEIRKQQFKEDGSPKTVEPVSADPNFQEIDGLEATKIATKIQNEHPQMIALLLSRLSSQKAAQVLAALHDPRSSSQPDQAEELDHELQKDIAVRIALMDRLPQSVLDTALPLLEQKLAQEEVPPVEKKPSPVVQAALERARGKNIQVRPFHKQKLEATVQAALAQSPKPERSKTRILKQPYIERKKPQFSPDKPEIHPGRFSDIDTDEALGMNISNQELFQQSQEAVKGEPARVTEVSPAQFLNEAREIFTTLNSRPDKANNDKLLQDNLARTPDERKMTPDEFRQVFEARVGRVFSSLTPQDQQKVRQEWGEAASYLDQSLQALQAEKELIERARIAEVRRTLDRALDVIVPAPILGVETPSMEAVLLGEAKAAQYIQYFPEDIQGLLNLEISKLLTSLPEDQRAQVLELWQAKKADGILSLAQKSAQEVAQRIEAYRAGSADERINDFGRRLDLLNVENFVHDNVGLFATDRQQAYQKLAETLGLEVKDPAQLEDQVDLAIQQRIQQLRPSVREAILKRWTTGSVETDRVFENFEPYLLVRPVSSVDLLGTYLELVQTPDSIDRNYFLDYLFASEDEQDMLPSEFVNSGRLDSRLVAIFDSLPPDQREQVLEKFRQAGLLSKLAKAVVNDETDRQKQAEARAQTELDKKRQTVKRTLASAAVAFEQAKGDPAKRAELLNQIDNPTENTLIYFTPKEIQDTFEYWLSKDLDEAQLDPATLESLKQEWLKSGQSEADFNRIIGAKDSNENSRKVYLERDQANATPEEQSRYIRGRLWSTNSSVEAKLSGSAGKDQLSAQELYDVLDKNLGLFNQQLKPDASDIEIQQEAAEILTWYFDQLNPVDARRIHDYWSSPEVNLWKKLGIEPIKLGGTNSPSPTAATTSAAPSSSEGPISKTIIDNLQSALIEGMKPDIGGAQRASQRVYNPEDATKTMEFLSQQLIAQASLLADRATPAMASRIFQQLGTSLDPANPDTVRAVGALIGVLNENLKAIPEAQRGQMLQVLTDAKVFTLLDRLIEGMNVTFRPLTMYDLMTDYSDKIPADLQAIDKPYINEEKKHYEPQTITPAATAAGPTPPAQTPDTALESTQPLNLETDPLFAAEQAMVLPAIERDPEYQLAVRSGDERQQAIENELVDRYSQIALRNFCWKHPAEAQRYADSGQFEGLKSVLEQVNRLRAMQQEDKATFEATTPTAASIKARTNLSWEGEKLNQADPEYSRVQAERLAQLQGKRGKSAADKQEIAQLKDAQGKMQRQVFDVTSLPQPTTGTVRWAPIPRDIPTSNRYMANTGNPGNLTPQTVTPEGRGLIGRLKRRFRRRNQPTTETPAVEPPPAITEVQQGELQTELSDIAQNRPTMLGGLLHSWLEEGAAKDGTGLTPAQKVGVALNLIGPGSAQVAQVMGPEALTAAREMLDHPVTPEQATQVAALLYQIFFSNQPDAPEPAAATGVANPAQATPLSTVDGGIIVNPPATPATATPPPANVSVSNPRPASGGPGITTVSSTAGQTASGAPAATPTSTGVEMPSADDEFHDLATLLRDTPRTTGSIAQPVTVSTPATSASPEVTPPVNLTAEQAVKSGMTTLAVAKYLAKTYPDIYQKLVNSYRRGGTVRDDKAIAKDDNIVKLFMLSRGFGLGGGQDLKKPDNEIARRVLLAPPLTQEQAAQLKDILPAALREVGLTTAAKLLRNLPYEEANQIIQASTQPHDPEEVAAAFNALSQALL